VTDDNPTTKQSTLDRPMTARDLATWGVEDVAYVREAVVDGTKTWAIFAADGSAIGVAPDRDMAFAAARQNDLEPLSVH
jgi:hypothetical protein